MSKISYLTSIVNKLDELETLLLQYTDGSGLTLVQLQKARRLMLELKAVERKFKPEQYDDEYFNTVLGLVEADIERLTNAARTRLKLYNVIRQELSKKDEPAPIPHREEPLCIVCKKRPRHFDEYCKRCVPADHRPKGKVV